MCHLLVTILQHLETTKTRRTLRTTPLASSSIAQHYLIQIFHLFIDRATSPFFEAVEFRRRSASAPLSFDLHLSLICWVNYRRIHRFAGIISFAPVALHILAAVHHGFTYSLRLSGNLYLLSQGHFRRHVTHRLAGYIISSRLLNDTLITRTNSSFVPIKR